MVAKAVALHLCHPHDSRECIRILVYLGPVKVVLSYCGGGEVLVVWTLGYVSGTL